MRIIIAGGSGFLGRALSATLRHDGHSVAILTRRPQGREEIAWTPDGSAGAWATALAGADAIVNLAGEPFAGRRWNDARKQQLRMSRLLATRSLVAAINQLDPPPASFLSASGVGYYGPSGDEVVTEVTPAGSDFLATLCVEWEREAEQASSVTRVALIRTGIVLHPAGGALREMLLPFRLGIGGRFGSGRQYMPWIHIDDWVGMAAWLIATETARGAFNGSAPTPVTNAEFTRTLGRVLRRPAMLAVPGFALRLAVGEISEVLLTGQRATPARAIELGFQFRYRDLEAALRNVL
jgi:uncharacterized protein